MVETYGFAGTDLEQRLDELGPRNYFGRFFRVIVENRKRPAWWVESRAAEEASLIEKSLGRWLWVLETIVTAAPLLGLLGTITGMIRAFKLFGAEGLVDPRGVTGGVAEALIATARGPVHRAVALFAFNYFSHRQAQVHGRDGAARHAARGPHPPERSRRRRREAPAACASAGAAASRSSR